MGERVPCGEFLNTDDRSSWIWRWVRENRRSYWRSLTASYGTYQKPFTNFRTTFCVADKDEKGVFEQHIEDVAEDGALPTGSLRSSPYYLDQLLMKFSGALKHHGGNEER